MEHLKNSNKNVLVMESFLKPKKENFMISQELNEEKKKNKIS